MSNPVAPIQRIREAIYIYKVTDRDTAMIADAREAINRSLKILRESEPATCLSKPRHAPCIGGRTGSGQPKRPRHSRAVTRGSFSDPEPRE